MSEAHDVVRAEAVTFINDYAPEHMRAFLVSQLQPAIALKVEGEKNDPVAVGASKFGGPPDVPPDFKWPHWEETPLGFVAQLNLSEIAAYDSEDLLPKSGHLAFFLSFDENKQVWGDAYHCLGWRVYYWEDQDLQRSRFTPYEHNPLPSLTLCPEVAWTLPFVTESWIAPYFNEESDLFKEDAQSDYLHFYNEFCERFSCYQSIGGWPNTLQKPMAGQCQEQLERYLDIADQWNPVASDEWRLLFQFDSQLFLGDDWLYVGQFYFWIRPEDLEFRDFSWAWLIQQIN